MVPTHGTSETRILENETQLTSADFPSFVSEEQSNIVESLHVIPN